MKFRLLLLIPYFSGPIIVYEGRPAKSSREARDSCSRRWLGQFSANKIETNNKCSIVIETQTKLDKITHRRFTTPKQTVSVLFGGFIDRLPLPPSLFELMPNFVWATNINVHYELNILASSWCVSVDVSSSLAVCECVHEIHCVWCYAFDGRPIRIPHTRTRTHKKQLMTKVF